MDALLESRGQSRGLASSGGERRKKEVEASAGGEDNPFMAALVESRKEGRGEEEQAGEEQENPFLEALVQSRQHKASEL
eukprot:843592-Rhodomonas_salina.3